MVQLIATIVWEITQRHKYRWHVKKVQIYSLSNNFR